MFDTITFTAIIFVILLFIEVVKNMIFITSESYWPFFISSDCHTIYHTIFTQSDITLLVKIILFPCFATTHAPSPILILHLLHLLFYHRVVFKTCFVTVYVKKFTTYTETFVAIRTTLWTLFVLPA